MLLTTHADAGDVSANNGWFRKLPSNLPAAGYFDLHNGSNRSISLIDASSPACGMLMLHKSEDMDGMMRMEDVASVAVPPGDTLRFAPGTYHLMCMDPTPMLRLGTAVPVRLRFADGLILQAAFVVRDANGR
ncbi:MAG: copper chaperone PCu(A)C [Rhizomicrobium sp.]